MELGLDNKSHGLLGLISPYFVDPVVKCLDTCSNFVGSVHCNKPRNSRNGKIRYTDSLYVDAVVGDENIVVRPSFFSCLNRSVHVP